MLKIECKPEDDLNVVFAQNQKLVKESILNAIEEGIDNNYDSVCAFYISHGNGDTFDFNISQNEYLVNLNDCLRYYENQEDFDKCIKIMKLKSIIES